MTVRLGEEAAIVLEGACPIEDSEPLLALLLQHPAAPVDWRACTQAHGAVAQVLLAARPAMLGPAGSVTLERWVAPALARARR